MKTLIVSFKGQAPKAHLDNRIHAVQDLEARVLASLTAAGKGHMLAEGRGNAAVRRFIEGQASDLSWGDGRIDIIDIPQENK